MHEVITSRTGTKHFAIFLFLNDLFFIFVVIVLSFPIDLLVFSPLFYFYCRPPPSYLDKSLALRACETGPIASFPSLSCLHFIPPLLGIDDITGPCVVPALSIPPSLRCHAVTRIAVRCD